MAKIERLYHLNGGGNACVIYLLEKGEKDITGMVAYMGLQAWYGAIPLQGIMTLQAAIQPQENHY
jgi:hypothetical protein